MPAMLVDIHGEVSSVAADLGISMKEAVARLCGSDDPLRPAPFLSWRRSWLFARTRNSRQRWESNHLIDGMFLPYAAGYADVVVGERNAIGYLRQARDCPPGARLATNLTEAVAMVNEELALRHDARR
jgi:hypothetical protein